MEDQPSNHNNSSKGIFHEGTVVIRREGAFIGWWVFTGSIILVIIGALLIMWLPGRSPNLVWRNILEVIEQKSVTEPQTTRLSSKAFSPVAGAHLLESGKYVNYVYYTGRAFVPDLLVINRGEKVRFINATNLTMRVGSRPESVSSSYYAEITEPKAEGKGSVFDTALSEPGVWSYENLSSKEPRVFGAVYVR
ncbi:MAG: hypothetical protein V4437_00790 [Patescibacteria group bacterium]